MAVWIASTPAWMASSAQSGPSPVRQWVWSCRPPGADRFAQRRDERPHALGRQEPAGILEEDRVHPEAGELPRLAGVVLVGVHGAQGVDDAAGHAEAGGLRRAHRYLHVAHVVERVVRRDVADAVRGDALRGELNHVVREELEGEEALGAAHDDQRRPGHRLAHQAHPLPGVLPQVAHAHVEDGAAHQVDRLEPGAVQDGRDGQHHGGGHARGPEGLVSVAERRVDERDGAHRVSSSSAQRVWTRPATKSGWASARWWKEIVVAMPSTRKAARAARIRSSAAGRSPA